MPNLLLETRFPYHIWYVEEDCEDGVIRAYLVNPIDSSSDDSNDDDSYGLDDDFEDKFDKYDGNLTDIGHIQVEEGDEEGGIWLREIEVSSNYQRGGIATNLLKLAIKHLELANIACVQQHMDYDFDLTPDGEQFIAGCLRKKIIKPELCRFTYDVPLSEDCEPYDNPGLDSCCIKEQMPKHFFYDDDEPEYGESSRWSEDDRALTDDEEATEQGEDKAFASAAPSSSEPRVYKRSDIRYYFFPDVKELETKPGPSSSSLDVSNAGLASHSALLAKK